MSSRWRRGRLRGALAALAAVVSLCAAEVQAAPADRPDTKLYREAQQALATLRATPKRQGRKQEWETVVMRYRRVVARYPQSTYCDDSLLAIGDLYRDMAKRFGQSALEADAIQAYRTLVKEYPSSRKAEPALFAVVDLARKGHDRPRLTEAVRAYLDTFPDGAHAAEVKAALRRGGDVQAASLPPAPPPGLAQVFDLRSWSGPTSTRVVIDVERQVPFKFDRIADPDRLWIDLEGTRLHPNLRERTSFPVGDGLLEQIRVGQNRADAVRVVLDFKAVKDHTVFYLQNPLRLVIDVQGPPRRQEARAASSPPPPAPRSTPNPAPPPAESAPAPAEPSSRRTVAFGPPPVPTPVPATEPAPRPAEPARAPETLPARRVGALEGPDAPAPRPRATPAPVTVDWKAEPAAPAPPPPAATARVEPARELPRPRTEPSPPEPAQANRAGTYSLARQLGLGARRIVIDAGHGGHDPGTIGPSGLQEKDLVLDVALRLEKMLRAELGVEVVMTRSTDVFIPLEQRTAIANNNEGDLFLSIHANSSRNAAARGVETYFLSFAVNRHAEAVAARENAISAATLKDLQPLVKAITLNSKIHESRDFAASVQEAVVAGLKQADPQLPDRGVHTAPFYVLIGASMPSVLAEIAFVSHPRDEKSLKEAAQRDRIARGLLEGVRSYLGSLDRTQMKQLTSQAPRSTVTSSRATRR